MRRALDGELQISLIINSLIKNKDCQNPFSFYIYYYLLLLLLVLLPKIIFLI